MAVVAFVALVVAVTIAAIFYLSGHVIAAVFMLVLGWPALEGVLYWRAKRNYLPDMDDEEDD